MLNLGVCKHLLFTRISTIFIWGTTGSVTPKLNLGSERHATRLEIHPHPKHDLN